MKTCSGCKLEQPYALFFKSPRHKDGYHGVCSPCNIAIGLLKDSPLVIERAKQYLVRDFKC